MKSLSGKLFLILFSLAVSCTPAGVNNLPPAPETVKQSDTVRGLQFSLTTEVPSDIKAFTHGQAKAVADKESKRRGIDYFYIPQNPFGLEITSGGRPLGYILNFIGTSLNTADLNVEVRAFYSEQSKGYSLNYSGPVTTANRRQPPARPEFSGKGEGLVYELITGLPPEHTVNRFEDYLEELKQSLKRNYQPKTIEIAEDNVFIYAIHYRGELAGFFFECHANKVILGERKYADMQIGVMVSADNQVKGNYALVAFNPKTELNRDPVYKIIAGGRVNLVQAGDL